MSYFIAALGYHDIGSRVLFGQTKRIDHSGDEDDRSSGR